ncbi:hypothetical protein ACLOJK_000315 [Asimina triloba]
MILFPSVADFIESNRGSTKLSLDDEKAVDNCIFKEESSIDRDSDGKREREIERDRRRSKSREEREKPGGREARRERGPEKEERPGEGRNRDRSRDRQTNQEGDDRRQRHEQRWSDVREDRARPETKLEDERLQVDGDERGREAGREGKR